MYTLLKSHMRKCVSCWYNCMHWLTGRKTPICLLACLLTTSLSRLKVVLEVVVVVVVVVVVLRAGSNFCNLLWRLNGVMLKGRLGVCCFTWNDWCFKYRLGFCCCFIGGWLLESYYLLGMMCVWKTDLSFVVAVGFVLFELICVWKTYQVFR